MFCKVVSRDPAADFPHLHQCGRCYKAIHSVVSGGTLTWSLSLEFDYEATGIAGDMAWSPYVVDAIYNEGKRGPTLLAGSRMDPGIGFDTPT